MKYSSTKVSNFENPSVVKKGQNMILDPRILS